VEVARGGGGGALGAPSEDAGVSRAHNAHTTTFSFLAFTSSPILCKWLWISYFWVKTFGRKPPHFSTFRRRKKEEMRFFCKSGLPLISRVKEEVKEKIGFSFTPNSL
jgi:hypothetical protein